MKKILIGITMLMLTQANANAFEAAAKVVSATPLFQPPPEEWMVTNVQQAIQNLSGAVMWGDTVINSYDWYLKAGLRYVLTLSF